jgi:hypothetical protein
MSALADDEAFIFDNRMAGHGSKPDAGAADRHRM